MPLEDLYSAIAWAFTHPANGAGQENFGAHLVTTARILLAFCAVFFWFTWRSIERHLTACRAQGAPVTWRLRDALNLYVLMILTGLLIDGALIQGALGNAAPLEAQRALRWISEIPPSAADLGHVLGQAQVSAVEAGVYFQASTQLLHGTLAMACALGITLLIGSAAPGSFFHRNRAGWFALAIAFGTSGWPKVADPIALQAWSGNVEPLLRQMAGWPQ